MARFAWFLVATAIVVSIGCSQKPESSSSVKITMPDWNALAEVHSKTTSNNEKDGEVGAYAKVVTISRVMINVSAPDLKRTVVYIWDMKDAYQGGTELPSAPKTVELEVESGSGRLFQVLAILQEIDTADTSGDSSGPMFFYYGDSTQTISKAVDLPITLSMQGTSGVDDGTVAGRYLLANGTGPTGKLNMLYAPAGRPEMIVDTGVIFSGFFQAFLPSGAQFSYRTVSGATIFDKISVDSFDAALGAQLMKIRVPAGFNERSASRSARNAQTKVVGFVGPGSTGRQVCYSNVPIDLANLYTLATVGDATHVAWEPLSTSSTRARVTGGGVGTSDGSCPSASGDFGSDHLNLRTQSLAYGDSPIGTRGPFQEIANGTNQFISASWNGSSLTLNWKYLRPTIGDSVGGVRIFTKVYDSNAAVNTRWHDAAPCSQLVSSFGFSEVTSVAAGTAANPVESYVLNGVTAADYQAGRHQTVLCPYAPSGAVYDFALSHNPSPNNTVVATHLMAKRLGATLQNSAASPTQIAESICTPIVIRTTDSSGNPGYRPGGGTTQLTYSLSATGDSYIHTDERCTSTGLKSGSIAMGGSELTLYLRLDPASAATSTLALTDTTASSTLVPVTYYLTKFGAAVATRILVATPAATFAHQCFPVTVARGLNSGGEFLPTGGSVGSSLFTSVAGLSFYSDGDCTATASGAYFQSAAGSAVSLFAKYTGVASSILIGLDNTGPAAGLTLAPASVSITQPTAVTKIRYSMPATLANETCVPFRAISVDALNRPSPVSSVTNVVPSFSSTPSAGGGFFNDSACTTASSSLVIGSGTTTSPQKYIRWAGTLGPISVGGTSTLPVDSASVVITAAPVAMITARVPEVVWTGTNYIGVGPQKIESNIANTMNPQSTFQIHLAALSPLGNPISNFNVADLSSAGIALTNQYGVTPQNCTTPVWNNGIAMLSNCHFPNDGYAAGYRVQFRTGGYPTPYPMHSTSDQFFIADPGDTYQINMMSRATSYYAGTCQPVLLQARFGSYLANPLEFARNITLNAGANTLAFYSDPSCTGGVITNTLMNPGESAKIVYIATAGTGTPVLSADGFTLFDPFTFTTPSWSLGGALSASQYRITVSPSTTLGSCEPVMITRTDANGRAVPATTNLSISISQTGMDAGFFTTPNCMNGQIVTTALATGQSAALVYMRTATATGAGVINVIDNDGGGANAGMAAPIQVSP